MAAMPVAAVSSARIFYIPQTQAPRLTRQSQTAPGLRSGWRLRQLRQRVSAQVAFLRQDIGYVGIAAGDLDQPRHLVDAGLGVTLAGAMKVEAPSFCRTCGLAKLASCSVPRCASMVLLPSCTVMMPLRLILMLWSVLWNVIGPLWPSTASPLLVTSWPAPLI